MRSAGRGIPTSWSTSIARSVASFLETCLWTPHRLGDLAATVIVGSARSSGSWKIMATLLPRTSRICFSGIFTSSLPSSVTVPRTTWPTFGNSFHDGQPDRALAAPDSPTKPKHSPSPTVNENAVDSTDGRGAEVELSAEVGDLENVGMDNSPLCFCRPGHGHSPPPATLVMPDPLVVRLVLRYRNRPCPNLLASRLSSAMRRSKGGPSAP